MDAQIIILFAVVGISLFFIITALLIRRTIRATIEKFSWERKVVLEHYVWVKETSYRGFPGGSRNQKRTTESYQSYEVIRHETRTTTVNNTTTTTTQPIYGMVPRTKNKYSYEIQKWIESRQPLATGEERSTLHWPTYTLDSNTQERARSKEERYWVFFQTSKGKKYKYELPETEWAAFDDTATYVLKITIFGQVTKVIPDKKQRIKMPGQTP